MRAGCSEPILVLTAQVVAVLNPLAKEKLTGELQDEITELQDSLSQAHEEARLYFWRSTTPVQGTLPITICWHKSSKTSSQYPHRTQIVLMQIQYELLID